MPHLPLEPNVTVSNFDAAWKETGVAGFGWIFNNHQGSAAQKSFALPHISSPLVAESIALLSALIHAIDLGFTNLHLASDSSNLNKALKSDSHPKELHGILHDVLDLSYKFTALSFNFISRDSNRSADALAKEALRNRVSEPPV